MLGPDALRIRMETPALMRQLVQFLERCECNVDDLDARTVAIRIEPAVDFASAMELVKAGLCYACGGEIALPLSRLGSTACQDCRDAGARLRDAALDGGAVMRERREWTRMKVEAYLKVWRAQHPDSRVEILG
jgi:hypothetical protein